MESEIIIGGVSLLGTLLGSFGGSRLTAYRIEQLEKKVDKHNNFAERIPIVEQAVSQIPSIEEKVSEIPILKEQIKVANHRIEDLEQHESELIKHEK